MKKFVLDTNLYIKAFRSEVEARELENYLSEFTPNTFVSSVVVHEVLVGAQSPVKARQVQEDLFDPLIRAGRILTPTHSAWERAAGAIAAMARDEGRDLRTLPKSLVNDFLLAASCRESGVTLITDNVDDFALIRRYLRQDHMGPWPKNR